MGVCFPAVWHAFQAGIPLYPCLVSVVLFLQAPTPSWSQHGMVIVLYPLNDWGSALGTGHPSPLAASPALTCPGVLKSADHYLHSPFSLWSLFNWSSLASHKAFGNQAQSVIRTPGLTFAFRKHLAMSSPSAYSAHSSLESISFESSKFSLCF